MNFRPSVSLGDIHLSHLVMNTTNSLIIIHTYLLEKATLMKEHIMYYVLLRHD
jgi:hypothetical protein